MMSQIGIVLVIYNQKSNLDLLYKSLADQTIKNFIIYFIDNNPGDGAIAFSKEINSNYHLNIKYYAQIQNTGFAEGNNIGAKQAFDDGCSHILVLNNDTAPDRKCLEEMLILFERDNIGAVGPIILLKNHGGKETIIQEFGATLDLRLYSLQKHFAGKPFYENVSKIPSSLEVDFLSGCAIMIRKEVYDEIGLWDEQYFAYGDEIDFSQRFSDTHFKMVVTKNAVVWHNHNWSKENKRGFYFEYYMIQRNKYLYLKKYNYYSGLIYNLFKDFIYLPLTLIWFRKICDLRLLRFYIKGTFDGLLNSSGRPELNL